MKNEDIIKVENLKYQDNSFVIRWNMTRLCNYYCDFCAQGNKENHLQKSKKESSKIRRQICSNLIKFIETKLNNHYEKIYIFLIGGEITILKDFLDILERLVNCNFKGNIKFHITTNLSADVETLKKMKEIFLTKKDSEYKRTLSIVASYYKQFTTEKEFISKIKLLYVGNKLNNFIINKENLFKNRILNKIISKYIKIVENKTSNISVGISYPLLSDEDYEEFLKFKKKYRKITNSINYIIIRNYHQSISEQLKTKLSNNNYKRIEVTLKDNKKLYFSNTSKIGLKIDNKHFNPQGMLCDSGINNLSIGNLGNVYRCPSCANKTVFGNILTDDIDLLSDKMICPSTSCNCDYYRTIERKVKKI